MMLAMVLAMMLTRDVQLQTGLPSSLAGEAGAVVRQGEVQFGAERQDAIRVDVLHAAVIAELYEIEINGLGDTGHLIDLAQVVRQIAIVGEPPQIALEQHVIDRVEANEGWKEPQIGLGKAVAHQPALTSQPVLQLVKRGE